MTSLRDFVLGKLLHHDSSAGFANLSAKWVGTISFDTSNPSFDTSNPELDASIKNLNIQLIASRSVDKITMILQMKVNVPLPHFCARFTVYFVSTRLNQRHSGDVFDNAVHMQLPHA